MKNIFLLLIICLLTIPLYPQQVSNWQNYSDMKNISAIYPASDGIWAATGGGAFFYNLQNNSFLKLHKTEGLIGSPLTAVTIDQSGKVWFGTADGNIDVYNPADKSIHIIQDIYNSNYPSKQINYLKAYGDTIYAATDFGVSLINANNFLFFDTIVKFGSFTTGTPVNSIVKIKNRIYACFQSGMAVQKKGVQNLLAPESWNVYTILDGLPSKNCIKAIGFQDSVIVATDTGLAVYKDTSWAPFLPQLNGFSFSDIISSGDSLFIAASGYLYLYNSQTLTKLNSSKIEMKNLAVSSFGIFAGSSSGLVNLTHISSINYLYPNGPAANLFTNMFAAPDGTLWSASGSSSAAVGCYNLNGSTWTNYNISSNPRLVSNTCYSVYADQQNTVYLGYWGQGFSIFKNNKFTNFDTSNTGMIGTSDHPGYLVITAFANDSKGNLWILNDWAANRKNLTMMSPDGHFYNFGNSYEANLDLKNHFNLVIDQYDTKWYACTDISKPGLFYFNENGTYNSTNDDISGFLNANNGLNSSAVSAVVVDNIGDVWVGTNAGINIITNVGSIFNSGSHNLSITPVYAVNQYSITAIAVDPLNRKWVGTNQGLLLLNSDGTQLLSTYNTLNSPLQSDAIISITVDKKNGRVFVGTANGLTSFDTPALNPAESFTKLFIYPNPFVLNGSNNQLTIDGLIRDSYIKILTITGKLVNEFASPGGRVAFWNGTDSFGNLVSSGIYIIAAFDQNANNVTTSKVAVLRK